MALWRTTNLRNGIANKLWPLYRGKRAGRLVKEREIILIWFNRLGSSTVSGILRIMYEHTIQETV